jgi:hypothetical protein
MRCKPETITIAAAQGNASVNLLDFINPKDIKASYLC